MTPQQNKLRKGPGICGGGRPQPPLERRRRYDRTAQIMQRLGATTDYNIDGGGSCTSAGLGEGSLERAAEQGTVNASKYTAAQGLAEAAAARAGKPQRALT